MRFSFRLSLFSLLNRAAFIQTLSFLYLPQVFCLPRIKNIFQFFNRRHRCSWAQCIHFWNQCGLITVQLQPQGFANRLEYDPSASWTAMPFKKRLKQALQAAQWTIVLYASTIQTQVHLCFDKSQLFFTTCTVVRGSFEVAQPVNTAFNVRVLQVYALAMQILQIRMQFFPTLISKYPSRCIVALISIDIVQFPKRLINLQQHKRICFFPKKSNSPSKAIFTHACRLTIVSLTVSANSSRAQERQVVQVVSPLFSPLLWQVDSFFCACIKAFPPVQLFLLSRNRHWRKFMVIFISLPLHVYGQSLSKDIQLETLFRDKESLITLNRQNVVIDISWVPTAVNKSRAHCFTAFNRNLTYPKKAFICNQNMHIMPILRNTNTEPKRERSCFTALCIVKGQAAFSYEIANKPIAICWHWQRPSLFPKKVNFLIRQYPSTCSFICFWKFERFLWPLVPALWARPKDQAVWLLSWSLFFLLGRPISLHRANRIFSLLRPSVRLFTVFFSPLTNGWATKYLQAIYFCYTQVKFIQHWIYSH